MPKLIDFFQSDDAEATEVELCQEEMVIAIDEEEEAEFIVQDFADFVRGLSCRQTSDNDLELIYQERTVIAGFQQGVADVDRTVDITVRAIRDVIKPDYEIRVLRSCLGTDTLAFVVDKPAVWHQLEAMAPEHLQELFVPFTDEIGFNAATN